jgi:O-antigen/teichoic acid export membrane protein
MLISSLIRTTFDNLYLLVIGKLFTPADLGYYNWAKKLQQAPTLMLAAMVGNVSFPVFSSLQDNRGRLRQVMRQGVTTLAFVSFPFFGGLLIIARPLIVLLLTEKWLPSVPYFQLLCVVGALYGWHLLNIQSLLAIGRSDLNLKLNLIKNGLRIANLFIMWRFGVLYIVCGEVITSLIGLYINTHYTERLSYGLWPQIKDVFPYLAATLLMVLSVYGVQNYIEVDEIMALILQVLTAFTVYLALNTAFKPRGFQNFLSILRKWVVTPAPRFGSS